MAVLRHPVVRLEKICQPYWLSVGCFWLRSVRLTEMSVLWSRTRAACTGIVRTSRIWHSVSAAEKIPAVKHDRAAQCFTVSFDSTGKGVPDRLRHSLGIPQNWGRRQNANRPPWSLFSIEATARALSKSCEWNKLMSCISNRKAWRRRSALFFNLWRRSRLNGNKCSRVFPGQRYRSAPCKGIGT